MSYSQVKKFDQRKAGKIKNFCLRNVRLGYGVPAKYDSAWEAWQNTEQHKNTDYPDGVEIPVYFSYTATIDGVRKNWGHIGVRLKDGKFWSDGVIYAGISAYTKNHAPKYVGWGESVNDTKVIKGEEMTEQDKKDLALGRKARKDNWQGQIRSLKKKLASETANKGFWRKLVANQVNSLTTRQKQIVAKLKK